jgi:Zn-dependent protease
MAMSDTTLAILIAVPVLFGSMVLHELMHAITADWLGDDTARVMGRITLNPIRHIDPFFTIALPLLLILSHSPVVFGAAKPVQVNFHRLKYDEFGGAIVGMIGPLTNLAIALIAALAFNLIQPTTEVPYKVLGFIIFINIGFFVFNSIPWPPLDGSRLLYAFAPRVIQEFMEAIEGFGMAGLIIFIFLFYQLSPAITHLISSIISVIAPNLNINLLI